MPKQKKTETELVEVHTNWLEERVGKVMNTRMKAEAKKKDGDTDSVAAAFKDAMGAITKITDFLLPEESDNSGTPGDDLAE